MEFNLAKFFSTNLTFEEIVTYMALVQWLVITKTKNTKPGFFWGKK